MRSILQTTLSAGLIALAGAAFAQTGGSSPGASPSDTESTTPQRSPSSESGTSGSMGTGSSGSTSGAASTTSAPPSDVVGKNVLNAEGDEIGEIEAVDGNNVIVSVGGFLGLGDHKVSLPWEQLSMSGAGEEAKISTSMTKDQLKAMPEYKESGASGSSGMGGSSSGGSSR